MNRIIVLIDYYPKFVDGCENEPNARNLVRVARIA